MGYHPASAWASPPPHTYPESTQRIDACHPDSARNNSTTLGILFQDEFFLSFKKE